MRAFSRSLSSGTSSASFPPHPHLHPPQSIADYPERDRRLSFPAPAPTPLPSFTPLPYSPPHGAHTGSPHSSPASWHSSFRGMSVSPSLSSRSLSLSHDGSHLSMSPPAMAAGAPLIESEMEFGPPNGPLPVLDDGSPYKPAPPAPPITIALSAVPRSLAAHANAMLVDGDGDGDPAGDARPAATPAGAPSAPGQAMAPAVDLAPLHSLSRSQPYRRSPTDDRTLRLLGVSPA